MAGERLDRKTLFLTVARAAFRDGALSEEENKLLNRLRKFLKLDKDVASELARTARHEFRDGKLDAGLGEMRPHELFRMTCEAAWEDGRLDEHERRYLTGVARILKLSEADEADLMARVEAAARPPPAEPGPAGEQVIRIEPEEPARTASGKIAKPHGLTVSGLLQMKEISPEAPRPPPGALDAIGGRAGAAWFAVLWLALLGVVYLVLLPVRRLEGIVARTEAKKAPVRLEFEVEGQRFATTQRDLARAIRPGDRLELVVREAVGLGIFLERVEQKRSRGRGYLYEDFGYPIALGGAGAAATLALIGMALAIRRVGA